MKKINKKIFPEDFFDLTNNQDELTHPKNKSKQKDHPKLLNPSNTIKIIPNVINEIKEEAFEESVEQLQPKKTNLKIIIPEKSNDELEPSTSGSSNVKLSPNKPPSPLIGTEKNEFNLHPENNEIPSNNIKNDKDKEEDNYKVTAHFVNEEKTNISFKENKNLNRPFTPNVNRYKNVYNPPLTCDNKNMDKFKFNYNFEIKKNGVIVPKKESKINQIQRQNLFKIGYNNNNSNRNNKMNKKKLKPVSSRIEQIFGTQSNNSPRNSSLVSIINLNEKNQSKNKNKNKEYNTNIINNNKKNSNINDLKKANNCNHAQKNPKKARANSVENKCMNKTNKVLKKNESNKDINKDNADSINKNKENERKKIYSHNKINKNGGISYLPEIKYANVKNQLEVEVNNLFQNLPEDFEKYPELKNYVELIVQNIHGLKDYIYKNTQDFFKKNRNNSSKNRK